MACSISPAAIATRASSTRSGRTRGHLTSPTARRTWARSRRDAAEGHGVYTMSAVIVTKARRGAPAHGAGIYTSATAMLRRPVPEDASTCGREVPRRGGIKQESGARTSSWEELAPELEPRYFAAARKISAASRACRPRPSPAPSCRDRLSAKASAPRASRSSTVSALP